MFAPVHLVHRGLQDRFDFFSFFGKPMPSVGKVPPIGMPRSGPIRGRPKRRRWRRRSRPRSRSPGFARSASRIGSIGSIASLGVSGPLPPPSPHECGSKLNRRGKPKVLVHFSTDSILEFRVFFEPPPSGAGNSRVQKGAAIGPVIFSECALLFFVGGGFWA